MCIIHSLESDILKKKTITKTNIFNIDKKKSSIQNKIKIYEFQIEKVI